MAHYIDKDALVAEIERRKKYYENIQKIKPVYESNIEDFNELLSSIDTLEVKEVDLEKEILDWIGDEDSCKNGKWTWYECNKMLRHFFELGLKSQKGE